MVDAKELLEYNDQVRRRYLDALSKLSWEDFTKNREASFHSIRNIFIHTMGATRYWLNFLQNQKDPTRREFDDYKTFQDVKDYAEQVERRMHNYLNTLPKEGLSKKYTVTDDRNQIVQVTAEDILIHVFEEEVHHRGEIIALLWQIGVEPPLMGWKYL